MRPATEIPERDGTGLDRGRVWETVGRESPSWAWGVHGERHANRVAAAGLRLAAVTAGADAAVVFAFGLLHDSQRRTDGPDRLHGLRAADYALELHTRGELRLDQAQLDTLTPVLRFHDRPACSSDPTAGCCLDADRLNLQRLGIAPNPRLLSTVSALELVDWTRDTLDELVPWAELAEVAGYDAGD